MFLRAHVAQALNRHEVSVRQQEAVNLDAVEARSDGRACRVEDADAEDACGWPPTADNASGSLLSASKSDDGCLVADH